MNKRIFAAAVGLAVSMLAACRSVQTPATRSVEISAEERARMQTTVYTGSYETVFASTLAVLQDQGWHFDTVDKPAGLIRATTERKTAALGPEDERSRDMAALQKTIRQNADVTKKWSRWKELVIHTEPWGANNVRQRIVMNLRGSLPSMSYTEEQGGGLFTSGRMVTINAPPTEQTVEVAISEAYTDIFERVGKGLRQRQSR